MKNILQIADYAAPYGGNFISTLLTLAASYKDEGEIYFLFPKEAKQQKWVSELNSSNVYYIDRSFFNYKHLKKRFIISILDIIKEHDIKLIHTHFITINSNLFFIHKYYRKRIKVIANLHNHYNEKGKLKLVKNYLFAHSFDYVIGDSPSVTQSAINIGFTKNNIETVLNCIQFDRLENTLPICYKESDPLNILMFGYPCHRKGVDIVIHAINNILKEHTIHLNIAAAGGFEAIKQTIIKELHVTCIPDWIKLLPPTSNLLDYYNNNDVFISAGREEGLTYSPIEAAYCKPIVICSKIQGNPLDIDNLFTYNVEDTLGLSNILQTIISFTPDKMKEVSLKQKEYVSQHYNIKHWTDSICRIYKKLL